MHRISKAFLRINPTTTTFARNLRKNQTTPELRLWYRIRNKQLGVKFRRQYSIPLPTLPPFEKGEGMDGGKKARIFDFYSPEIKLAIELDGESHYQTPQQHNLEIKQDKALYHAYGIKVVRFLNSEVMKNIEGVIESIQQNINPSLHPLPNPPPNKGRELDTGAP